eukprot:1422987-Pleurochrysis_carterae.AAC.1
MPTQRKKEGCRDCGKSRSPEAGERRVARGHQRLQRIANSPISSADWSVGRMCRCCAKCVLF